jgi:hypothetical protein
MHLVPITTDVVSSNPEPTTCTCIIELGKEGVLGIDIWNQSANQVVNSVYIVAMSYTLWKESLNSDCQQFNQYEENKQSPRIMVSNIYP